MFFGFLVFFTCNKCVKNYEWSLISCMVLNFMDSNITICTTYIAWRACRKQEDIWFRSGNGPLFMNQTIVHVISYNTKPSRFQAPKFIKCMSVCGVFLYWYHFCGAELKYSLPVYMIPQLSTLDRSTCTSNYQLETH